MNCMSPYIYSVIDVFSYTFNHQKQKTGQWALHHIRFIEDIPNFFQQNAKMTTIISINALFFFAIHAFVNRLNEKLTKVSPPLTDEQRMIKYLLLDGMLLGGSIACVNFLFSKIMNYSLNETQLKMMSLIAIVSHTLLNLLGKCLQKEHPILEIQKGAKNSVLKPDVFNATSQKFPELKRDLNNDLSVIWEGDCEESFYYGPQEGIENLEIKSEEGDGMIDGDEYRRSISYNLAEEAKEFLTEQRKLNKFQYKG